MIMNKDELYWRYYAEQREHARSFYAQRTSISQLITTLVGALLAFSATRNFDSSTLPVACFIAILGFYGYFATQKIYERQKYHFRRATKSLEKLVELVDPDDFFSIQQEASLEHSSNFKYAGRFESNVAWLVLHGLMTALGVFLVFYILSK
jgi:hypothetical protein